MELNAEFNGINQVLEIGEPQPTQEEFLLATAKYVAYGGARGGGKSWVVRAKAKILALSYAGIKILIVRRKYVDLQDNHINPLLLTVPKSIATYKANEKTFVFFNGSRIKCCYFENDNDALQYQGQEYDVIFLEEGTQFKEIVFNTLKACVRGANKFPKRIYITCNPGGVGHLWVKRLFITRDFLPGESPEDYAFIQSRVYDNKILCESDPEYVKQLESLPESMRRAWLEGDWDTYEGQYFDEFRREIHTCDPFPLDKTWRRYRSIDYGLDRLACLWYAVDNERNVYVYKELCVSNLTISAAAAKIRSFTDDDENIYSTLAPPDLWGRSQETGKSKAYLFQENGVTLTQSNNDREAGWLCVKELLKVRENNTSQLVIFKNCKELINCLPELQHDEKKPTDCATEPHEITHAPDSLRYFAIYWTRPANPEQEKRVKYRADIKHDWIVGTPEIRARIEKMMGGKPL